MGRRQHIQQIAAPNALYAMPAYAPLLDLISDQLVSTEALAIRWGYSVHHMGTLRRQQRPARLAHASALLA